MELKDAILKRRSVRKFTDEKVCEDLITELLVSAMAAPSACNRQPWEFFVVTNEDKLSELYMASRFTRIKAKLCIVVCGNLKRSLPMQLASYWIQDTSAATENILLRATDLGLGAVWCGIHPQKRAEDKVTKILELDEKLIPLNIIWLGYPDEHPEPRTQYDKKKVHFIK